MTLEEYKIQVKEIQEAAKNFNGTQQEAIELFENFAKKYPDLNKFNIEAMQCEDLKEFKDLADSFGMKFSSDESAEKLFSTFQENKKQLDTEILKYKNGAKLSAEDLSNVTGGSDYPWYTQIPGRLLSLFCPWH